MVNNWYKFQDQTSTASMILRGGGGSGPPSLRIPSMPGVDVSQRRVNIDIEGKWYKWKVGIWLKTGIFQAENRHISRKSTELLNLLTKVKSRHSSATINMWKVLNVTAPLVQMIFHISLYWRKRFLKTFWNFDENHNNYKTKGATRNTKKKLNFQ